MPHLDEGTIHAWLDGALSDDEALAASAHVDACTRCAAAMAEARGLVAASSRILSALDAVPSRVVPAASAAAPRRAAWWQRPSLRIAAAIVVVTAGTVVARREIRSPEMPRSAALQARDEVAELKVLPKAVQPSAPAAVPAAPSAAVPAAPPAAPGTAPATAHPAPADRPAATPSIAPAPLLADKSASRRDAAPLEAKRETSATGAGANASVGLVVGGRGPDSGAVSNQLASTMAKSASADAAPALSATIEARAGHAASLRELSEYDVRAASGRLERRVYEVRGGVQVTLDIGPMPPERASAGDALSRVAAPRGAKEPAALAAQSARPVAMHSIEWSDASGTRYTLTGPLSESELERVRAVLPPLQ